MAYGLPKIVFVPVTLTLETTALDAGDVAADTQVVTGALYTNGRGILQSLTVIDQDDNKAVLDVWFLKANVTMGTEDAAPSITDANALNILGCVPVVANDYKDLGGASVACFRNLNLLLEPATGTGDIYVAVVNGSGTPTYTAAGIKLILGIVQD